MKSVLVTGSGGMLGAELLERLARRGFAPVPLARRDADITDANSVREAVSARSPDMVVNCAAMTAVDACEDERDRAFAVNRDGAGHVSAAAAAIGVPIIHISTDYVFDGRANVPYKEESPRNPLGVYGASKAAGELAVAAANPEHYIIRTSWLCGKHGSNFVKTILRLADSHPELNVVNDQAGSPTFAADLADALCTIATAHFEARTPPYGIYHITNAGFCTWHHFAKTILEFSGKAHIPVHPIDSEQARTMLKYKATRPGYSVLDCSRASAVFGVRLQPWQVALETYLSDMQSE
jgi:dTDP-4-dehydrorhamnose reductase